MMGLMIFLLVLNLAFWASVLFVKANEDTSGSGLILLLLFPITILINVASLCFAAGVLVERMAS